VFGKRITLFSLFGFSVKIDMSWLVIAALITWSLSADLFPHYYKGLAPGAYVVMGVVGALGLFASIVFHELCHSLVARTYGLPMKGITLFIFGGVAEMDDEPPSAKVEFLMALAGPVSSVALAVGFSFVYLIGQVMAWPIPLIGVLGYLGLINGMLAAFNLLPAFPLDGGRVLRAALWSWKKNLKWATRTASQIGSGFGLVLILMGGLALFTGNVIGGVWWFLIGMFLRGAARMSYSQLITRQALQGEPVGRFMETSPMTVPPGTTIEDFVENYIYKYHYKMFPVVDGAKLVGCITTRQVKEIPRDEWANRNIEELSLQCSPDNTITAEADSLEALSRMNKTGASRLMVLDGDRLVGIVSLKDMLKFLSLKVELEEE
jgi:Zn-dependent protease/predicted transcriptional regulator